MTTLPQSAPLRLPRPPASTQLSIAGPGQLGAYAPAANSAAANLTGADMWRVVRANIWLIILMLIVSGAAGYGAFYWLNKYHAKFSATGSIQITPVAIDLYRGGQAAFDVQTMALEQATQVHTMKNGALVSNMIANRSKNGIQETQWYKSHTNEKGELNVPDAKADLSGGLVISALAGTKIIDVSFTCSDIRSPRVIVEAFIQEHVNEQQKSTTDQTLSRSHDLQNKKSSLDQRRHQLQEDIASEQNSLGAKGMEGSNTRVGALDMELSGLIQSKLKAKQDLSEAQDNLDSIRTQINNDQDPAQVEQSIEMSVEVARYTDAVSQLDIAITEALQKFKPDHPSVIALTQRRDTFQEKLTTARADVRSRSRTQLLEAASSRVVSLQHNLDNITSREREVRNDMASLSADLFRLASDREDLAVVDIKLRMCEEQLDQIADLTNRSKVSSVGWNTHPVDPDKPSFPKLEFVMPMAMVLGLFVALGIAFLREVMDTTIRSPRDISRVGNMNLLGMVPHEDDDPQSAGARLPVVIFEAPHSMMAEQLRQVRTRLQHTASLDTTRSILVTSPSPGDGKSTIACNLASGLALNGRRILLVDANFRRPELHRVFNLGNEHGFSDVLNNLDQFEHSVQETQVPNLYVLPSGLKPTNATELLESQLLIDFIERALEEFDHVVFDSGPLLFVSETVALAPRVDGVLTVVRARTNSRGVLTRLRDSLKQIKAEHLGVVLNAVRTQGGGYYGRNIRTYYEYQDGPGSGRAA